MRLRPLRVFLAALLLGASAVVPVSAAAPAESAVATWNRHAVTALFNPVVPTVPGQLPGAGQPPTVGVLHLAMVQGAVYDAVNAIAGNREPYLPGLDDAPANANRRAAVATAAYHVLAGLQTQALPQAVRDRLANDYAAFLARIPNGPRKTAGIAAGADAAAAMLAERVGDGRYPATPVSFPVGMGAGQWRPTASGSDLSAWVANVEPFVVNSSSQFSSDGPLPLTSARYAAEYAQVKALGEKDESTRNARQTAMANFFIANPVEMYNRNFRAIASTRGLSLAAEARLFAAVNLAGADALITCWADKFKYPFWRPETAIRNGDADGNSATAGDSDWEPLLPNPPYPDHPSGYNCLTGGMMHAAAGFFGTNRVAFDLVHGNGTVRHYSRFTDVVSDTIRARIYLGIHFRTPDVQGAEIGRDVARWLTNHELRADR
jgi:hypothetical protein